MEKVDLTKQFAFRLKDAMLDAGYNSKRSTSGVCVHQLAKITNYSVQICRKYLRGEAIPDPAKLVEIAECLHVSPGWLLFGDQCNDRSTAQNKILISKALLHYIFKRAAKLYTLSHAGKEVANFLIDLVNDVSQIDTDEEQLKKIIDLALLSINHLTPNIKQE